jgi:hypothetical protein
MLQEAAAAAAAAPVTSAVELNRLIDDITAEELVDLVSQPIEARMNEGGSHDQADDRWVVIRDTRYAVAGGLPLAGWLVVGRP